MSGSQWLLQGQQLGEYVTQGVGKFEPSVDILIAHYIRYVQLF